MMIPGAGEPVYEDYCGIYGPCVFQKALDRGFLSDASIRKLAGQAMHMASIGFWIAYCLSCLKPLSDAERETMAFDRLH